MNQINLPKHIAVIMDGNGRWAKQKHLPRIKGHQEGVRRVEDIIEAASDLGIKYLTLYAFSKENWQRPQEEVQFLMGLLSAYLDEKIEKMKKNNLIFNTIGDIEDLPSIIQKKIQKGKEETKQNTGMTVSFAFSYSSRSEITRATREIAKEVQSGQLQVDDINEDVISKHLYTANLPDPDLLIRTSGEMRISNFLLWQISYAELYITEKLWPQFDKQELAKAIEVYQTRERRFGKTTAATPEEIVEKS